MAGASAVFIGDGSLLIRCAQAWRGRGHEIRAVLSQDPGILDWARAEGIAAVPIDDAALLEAPREPFDYLFSIANLRVLPPAFLRAAGRLAINFHDGPLPRYAGLHAPSWALLAREPGHGVTWHEMTAQVDTGRIVRQALFAIEPDDTAFSLNARCYEAGLASFEAMADDIGRGELRLSEQDAAGRSYYARHRRPPALATLDFSQPAAQLAALVRALDFGPYANPLGRPKLWAGPAVLYVRTARLLPPASGGAPGTVIAIEGDEAHIATAAGGLALGGITDAKQQPALHLLAPGMVLPALDDALREQLDACTPRVARGEPSWRTAFASLSPVALPYPRMAAGAPPAPPLRLKLKAAGHGSSTAAAFFAWLSALTGQEQVSALYCDAALAGQAEGLQAWLSPWVPLTLQTSVQSTAKEAAAQAEVRIAQARDAGPWPHDLPSRAGADLRSLESVSKVALGPATVTPPAGVELMLAHDGSGRALELVVDAQAFSEQTAQVMASHLQAWLEAFERASGPIAGMALLPPKEAEAVAALNATTTFFDTDCCVHEAIAAQAARTPQQPAVLGQGQQLTYSELDERAAALAAALVRRGVRPGDIVGLCLERTPEMVVALLAILKAGAAYLPLDPAYPGGRIAFMIEDSAAPLVVTTSRIAASLGLPVGRTFLFDGPLASGSTADLPAPMPDRPAYLIYTSGSTGNPKGVVVTHRNVMNLFAGMADRIPHDPPGRWLAVTSLSFDISVLELFWTLAHGFTVVMHSDTVQDEGGAPEFSLFYFATDNARDPKDRYKLLLEGAKFADREGFAAIWTPERHFHAFGGLYPNPAVTSAAIAAITTRLKIRAGSCVLPLHHPIRVAEEWAFVDNISQGRVGISFASGWQPNDFVIAPQAFAERKAGMIRNVDVVRRLWRGEAVAFPGPQGKPVETRTLPRPVQPELPVWLTAAGNPETFQQAGEMGCHLLTHLLGQTLEDVTEKIKLYRAAWRRAGHAGHGHVTLMLHTFVGDDEDAVRETVRGPMKEYLRSSLDLIKQAAWSFPTFVQRGAEAGKTPVEIMDSRPLSPEEMDALLEHAFSRYYGTSALFGTPARCLALVGQLKQAGVDEIACLVDFGVDADTVLDHLGHLKQLMDAARAARPAQRRVSVAGEIAEHAITHLQCTPSMAAMLAADAAGRLALSQLSVLLVGGEALPLKLARELRSLVPDALLNVYGPTETTVWSTTCNLDTLGGFVPLGRAIANTQLSVRTPWGQECPALVPGELFIGGEGVARGYWQRPALTAERFVADAAQPGARLYRTGDLVRRHPGGALEFLGRIDHQVKIRGHRIELGEIEAALLAQPGVAQAVVIAAGDEGDDTGGRLFGYVTAAQAAAPDPEQLREALAARLPAVMVPQRVLVLPAMPLTPNGKVDRRALPDPRAAIAVRSVAAPRSELEKTIAAVWCEVLGVPAVGMTDNFFDLGGHSLLVVQVQRRLGEVCGREVSITDMFRLPTVRALAAHLEGGEPGTAVSDGLDRARARRLMRSRAGLEPTPTA